MKEIIFTRAKTDIELKEILSLQRENLPQQLSQTDKVQEGFLTVQHTFELLKKMNSKCAHIIAKHDDKVIGYALCMLQEFKNDIPVLVPMFKQIDTQLKKQNKQHINYIVMGQICVSKNYRKQGVFRGLYLHMQKEMASEFDAIITEVDASNIRSSNAHKAVGFELLHEFTSNNQHWELILLKV